MPPERMIPKSRSKRHEDEKLYVLRRTITEAPRMLFSPLPSGSTPMRPLQKCNHLSGDRESNICYVTEV
jgi:hypothetical protein